MQHRIAVVDGQRSSAYSHERVNSDEFRNYTFLRFHITELHDALAATYPFEAYCVMYTCGYAGEVQPRLFKELWREYPLRPSCNVLFADVDNPGKSVWTPEIQREFEALWSESLALRTVGVYRTTHGYRIVQPLSRDIDIEEIEPILHAWLAMLEEHGVPYDKACKDWTRHFRLPHVKRDGKPFRSVVDLSRMVPIMPPLPRAEPAAPLERRGLPRPRGASPVVHVAPDEWKERAPAIARALLGIADPWHPVSMALSGALLQHGAPTGQLVSVVRAVFAATGADSRVASRGAAAQTTINRWVMGYPIVGRQWLESKYPAFLVALDAAMTLGGAALPTLDDARLDLRSAIRAEREGVTVIAAECGLGKTHETISLATDRARRGLVLHSKTAFSVERHERSIEIATELRDAGVSVRRLYGPLSAPDYVEGCQQRDIAQELMKGGLSVRKELCEGRHKVRCPFYEGCAARIGAEGPTDARVVIGPHELLGELDASAGSTGVLVIDEPPAASESVTFSADDIAWALKECGSLEAHYGEAMNATLVMLGECLATQQQPDLEALRVLMAPTISDAGPAVTWSAIHRAHKSATWANALGKASRVWSALQSAINSERGYLRIQGAEEGRSSPLLYVAWAHKGLQTSLGRDGRVLLLDANADLNIDIYETILGTPPWVSRIAAGDGARVDRTLFRYAHATRNRWCDSDDENAPLEHSLIAAARRVVAWANGGSLAVITFMSLAKREDFRALFPFGTLFGWYGAIRGNNGMMHVDCLATLGDPRPHPAVVEIAARMWGVSEEGRSAAMARAELEQAHGRLRAPQRLVAARACHVGAVWPGGSGWVADGRVAVEEFYRRGRPRTDGAASAADVRREVELRGGCAAVATLLGVSMAALYRYMKGVRNTPVKTWEKLLELPLCEMNVSPKPLPIKEPLRRGFGECPKTPQLGHENEHDDCNDEADSRKLA